MKFAPILIGTFIGLVLAAVMALPSLNTLAESIPGFWAAYGILHYPAGALSAACLHLRLAPAGDAAFWTYPVSVFLQWEVTGILTSWLLCRVDKRRQSNSSQTSDS